MGPWLVTSDELTDPSGLRSPLNSKWGRTSKDKYGKLCVRCEVSCRIFIKLNDT